MSTSTSLSWLRLPHVNDLSTPQIVKIFSGLNVVSTVWNLQMITVNHQLPVLDRGKHTSTHALVSQHSETGTHTWHMKQYMKHGNHPSIPSQWGSSHSCTRSLASILFGRTTRVSNTSFPWRQEGLMLMLAALVTLLLLAYISIFSSWSVPCFPS